jgi:hypothetical protein
VRGSFDRKRCSGEIQTNGPGLNRCDLGESQNALDY